MQLYISTVVGICIPPFPESTKFGEQLHYIPISGKRQAEYSPILVYDFCRNYRILVFLIDIYRILVYIILEGGVLMISDMIRKTREKKGISMRQAAIDMGFPYTTYVNYEKGISEPNSEALVKIAVYYGVSADYLLEVKQKESPSPVEDEREAYRNMLSELTEDELKEMKNFTSYLRWKRDHPQDASDK
jgi:transcriptional regulator with XRE-family HTH domain